MTKSTEQKPIDAAEQEKKEIEEIERAFAEMMASKATMAKRPSKGESLQ